jgi:hypothetical protein
MTVSRIQTHDCTPTLTDSQVVDFCATGFVMLEGVVPQEINNRVTAYLNEHDTGEPTEILDEDWFVDNVILNEAAAGTVRSLLGNHFHIPVLMSNHRRQCPHTVVGGWHVDGGSLFGPELNDLQVFYLPQDTPVELGPTQIVPGSHHWRNQQRYMAHYDGIRDAFSTTSPAGSIFITDYSIWHRATTATESGLRNMLKYVYWRTVPPQRDWISESGFNLATAEFHAPGKIPRYGEQFRESRDTAEMFLWLCGRDELYRYQGGQAWPLPANRNDAPYGMPDGIT